MKMSFKKMWWKWLGVLLIVSTIIAGFLIPLKPGIQSIYPQSAIAGQSLEFEITGYNTHYKGAKNNVYLKHLDDVWICANSINILSETTIKAKFTIPSNLKLAKEYESFSLVMNNEVDGYSLLPDAIKIKSADNGTDKIKQCEPELSNVEALNFPYRNQLKESIRNQFFHVPMWFAMTFMAIASLVFSIMFLVKQNIENDIKAVAINNVIVLLGLLGLATGMLWAKYTWGAWWNFDIKQTTAAIAVMIYLAYFVLRKSITDMDKRARISAAFNIFAFVSLIALTFVIPRLTEASQHPGSGGNPGFGRDDLDNTMRMIFYPAVIGFTLISAWIAQLIGRYFKVKHHINLNE